MYYLYKYFDIYYLNRYLEFYSFNFIIYSLMILEKIKLKIKLKNGEREGDEDSRNGEMEKWGEDRNSISSLSFSK